MNIYEKLLEVQKEIKPIVKDSTNPHFKNKYFDINTLLAEVKPILNKHGLVLIQGLSTSHTGGIALTTKIALVEKNPLVQTSGEVLTPVFYNEIEFTCPLPECADAQKYGSALTYFRRYAVQSILALEAEDDDAELARPKPQVVNKPTQYKPKTQTNSDINGHSDNTDLDWM